MRAVDLLRGQILRFARDHNGAMPLYLITSQEVFDELRRWLVSRGMARCVFEGYAMFEGVEIFPVGTSSFPDGSSKYLFK